MQIASLWQNGRKYRRLVTERAVRPKAGAVPSTVADRQPGLLEALEDLAAESVVPELAGEGLLAAFPPGLSDSMTRVATPSRRA